MEIEVASSTVIPSAAVTTTDVEIELTVFDRLASDMHVGVLYAIRPPTPTTREMIDGLVKTLLHFPTLAGEFTGGGTILRVGRCGGGGVLVVEARVVDCELADHLGSPPSRGWLMLHPSVEEPKCLSQFQLNRFRCGGLVIGASSHHRVADGKSMSNFFRAWGRAVRGLDVKPLPIYENSWLILSGEPPPEFQHWGVEFLPPNDDHLDEIPLIPKQMEPKNLCNLHVHYTCEFITKHLKPTIGEKHTTFVSLLAHVWRKITIARGLNGEDSTRVRIAMDGRRRLKPPVPPEYFGNLVVNAYPTAKVRDLISGGTVGAARTIQGSIAGVGDGYIRSLIEFGERTDKTLLAPVSDKEGTVLCPNLEVDSWLGFSFDDVDFGGGSRVSRFCPTWIQVEGVIVFSPSIERDGVNLTVTLFDEHAKVFREISHLIDG